jgi:hypothetical protein
MGCCDSVEVDRSDVFEESALVQDAGNHCIRAGQWHVHNIINDSPYNIASNQAAQTVAHNGKFDNLGLPTAL